MHAAGFAGRHGGQMELRFRSTQALIILCLLIGPACGKLVDVRDTLEDGSVPPHLKEAREVAFSQLNKLGVKAKRSHAAKHSSAPRMGSYGSLGKTGKVASKPDRADMVTGHKDRHPQSVKLHKLEEHLERKDSLDAVLRHELQHAREEATIAHRASAVQVEANDSSAAGEDKATLAGSEAAKADGNVSDKNISEGDAIGSEVATTLAHAAKAGQTKLQLVSIKGFVAADVILIGREMNSIKAVLNSSDALLTGTGGNSSTLKRSGALVLANPLREDHPAGELVRRMQIASYAGMVVTEVLLVLSILYAVPCLLVFLFYLKASRLSSQKLNDLDNLCKEVASAADIVDMRNEAVTRRHCMQDMQKLFSARRDVLQKFLSEVEQYRFRLVGEQANFQLADPLRAFLLWWCESFQDCARDPVVKPLMVVEPGILDAQKQASSVCSYAKRRLAACSLNFVDVADLSQHRKAVDSTRAVLSKTGVVLQAQLCPSWLQLFGRNETYFRRQDYACSSKPKSSRLFPHEIDSGILKVNFLSPTHFAMFAALLLGFVLVAANMSLKLLPASSLVLLAMVLLAVALSRVDRADLGDCLEGQERSLTTSQAELQRLAQDIDVFERQAEQLLLLWRQRTLLRLDVAEAVAAKLTAGSWTLEECREFLFVVVRALAAFDRSGIGERSHWLGSTSLSKDVQQLLLSRASNARDLLKSRPPSLLRMQMVNLLGAPAHALMVRVQTVINLPAASQSWCHAGGRYVRLRLAHSDDWFCTSFAVSSEVPIWQSDVLFLLRGGSEKDGIAVVLELNDEGGDNPLGDTKFGVSAEDAGKYKKMLLPLESGSMDCGCAEMKVDMLYTSEVGHLLGVKTLPKSRLWQPGANVPIERLNGEERWVEILDPEQTCCM
eukprot:TRINITY_DN35645_c0_g1_i2.p1 TRINITY_DN35645_c0_g1~~TRINITY_DN35645_c0_g1_i2.p1  ORF type:complete len:894 (+),score=208.86 TRINITY_DN35645_c0_g1_i2:140-2821(+)